MPEAQSGKLTSADYADFPDSERDKSAQIGELPRCARNDMICGSTIPFFRRLSFLSAIGLRVPSCSSWWRNPDFGYAYFCGLTSFYVRIHTLLLGMNSKIRATLENLKCPECKIFFIRFRTRGYADSGPRARTEFSQRSCNIAQG
jgi:hypothetical protein